MACLKDLANELKDSILKFYFVDMVIRRKGAGKTRRPDNLLAILLLCKDAFTRDQVMRAMTSYATFSVKSILELVYTRSLSNSHKSLIRKIQLTQESPDSLKPRPFKDPHQRVQESLPGLRLITIKGWTPSLYIDKRSKLFSNIKHYEDHVSDSPDTTGHDHGLDGGYSARKIEGACYQLHKVERDLRCGGWRDLEGNPYKPQALACSRMFPYNKCRDSFLKDAPNWGVEIVMEFDLSVFVDHVRVDENSCSYVVEFKHGSFSTKDMNLRISTEEGEMCIPQVFSRTTYVYSENDLPDIWPRNHPCYRDQKWIWR